MGGDRVKRWRRPRANAPSTTEALLGRHSGTLAQAAASVFEGHQMLNASQLRSAAAETLSAKTVARVRAEHSRDGSSSSMNTQLRENIFEMGTDGGD